MRCMDFRRAKKHEINDLIQKYQRIKRRSELDLAARETNVKSLLGEQEKKRDVMSKLVLAEYITQEVVPILKEFDPHDREIVRQYFRFISKAETIYPGFIINPPIRTRR
jgi:hypothetical protein